MEGSLDLRAHPMPQCLGRCGTGRWLACSRKKSERLALLTNPELLKFSGQTGLTHDSGLAGLGLFRGRTEFPLMPTRPS
jgi:hypothetical protein